MKRAAYGYLAAGVVLTLGYVLVAAPEARAVIYQTLSVGAWVGVLAGARLHRPANRYPWLLFAAGLFLWSAGDAYWNAYPWVMHKDPAFPSPADGMYLAAYPFLAAGVITLMRGWGRTQLRDILDGAIVLVAAALVVWVLLIGPLARGSTLSPFGTVASVGTVVGDVLLLGAFAQLLSRRFRSNLAVYGIAASIVLVLLADYVYAYLNLKSAYTLGMPLDAGWLLSYTLFAAAALHPSMRSIEPVPAAPPRLSRLRMAGLGAALLTPPVALLAQTISSVPRDTLEIGVGGTVVVLLVAWRVWLLSREREQVQAELARQNKQLLELDAMKDELIALVSHELQTPLTSIVGYLELIGDDSSGGQLSEEKHQHVEIAERNAQRLAGLVSDLLLTAQLRAGRMRLDPEVLDVVALAAECVTNAAPRARDRGVELHYAPHGQAFALADPGRLAQVIDNLLSNAIKFTPAGGRTELRVDHDLRHVVIEVEDTGIGIAEAEQSKLFTPFFRATSAVENSVKGTGLGLSIVKGIVEAHNGTIAVSSRASTGSTFRIELPVAEVVHPALDHAA